MILTLGHKDPVLGLGQGRGVTIVDLHLILLNNVLNQPSKSIQKQLETSKIMLMSWKSLQMKGNCVVSNNAPINNATNNSHPDEGDGRFILVLENHGCQPVYFQPSQELGHAEDVVVC